MKAGDVIALIGVVVGAGAAIVAAITTIRMARSERKLAYLRSALERLNPAAEQLERVDDDGVRHKDEFSALINNRLCTGRVVLSTIVPWISPKEASQLEDERDRFSRWRIYQLAASRGEQHPHGEEPPSPQDMGNAVVDWFEKIYELTHQTRRHVAAQLRESAPDEFVRPASRC